MKKILLGLIIISGIFFSTSCSNDFDLIADWKDIPVVYALLASSDTAHYVRVEKAFLDPNTSALELAQNVDSIYYPGATVKLVDVVNNTEYPFIRVDGNLEGYQREEGVFTDSPNWLYKLKTDGVDTIQPDRRYELIVRRDETSEPVTATITTVSNVEITNPGEPSNLVSFYTVVSSTNPLPTPLPYKFKWRYNNDNTVIFDASLTFHYTEESGGSVADKSFTMKLKRGEEANLGTTRAEVSISTEDFYRFVASNIQPDNSSIRHFVALEFEVIGGNQSFSDYLSVNQANTGLTSSQLIPNFTNLSEGYGLFASIHKVTQMNFMNLTSRDSLRSGQYTGNLNFQ